MPDQGSHTTPPDSLWQTVHKMFGEANEAKHKGDDLSMLLWHSGRANAFAQVLSAIERGEASDA